MGVPSISSNLTGFANYIEKKIPYHEESGIFVVDRRFSSTHESVSQLVNIMHKFCKLNRRQRIEMRNRTERLSEMLGWNTLGKEYTAARNLAFEKTFQ